MVLSNTYHLWVRPGHEGVRALGGLHKMMDWSGPILTDSGGYQVFSLRKWTKVTEEGVRFRSPEDGQYRMLTPEKAVEIQEALGVDVAMAFDECIEWPATRERALASTQRTTRWLHRALEARQHPDRTALFGIVQGGMYEDLRAAHAREITAMDLDGMPSEGSLWARSARPLDMAECSAAEPPEGSVRYLMVSGTRSTCWMLLSWGIGTLCVADTRREARAGVHVGGAEEPPKRSISNGYRSTGPKLRQSCLLEGVSDIYTTSFGPRNYSVAGC